MTIGFKLQVTTITFTSVPFIDVGVGCKHLFIYLLTYLLTYLLIYYGIVQKVQKLQNSKKVWNDEKRTYKKHTNIKKLVALVSSLCMLSISLMLHVFLTEESDSCLFNKRMPFVWNVGKMLNFLLIYSSSLCWMLVPHWLFLPFMWSSISATRFYRCCCVV